MGCFAGLSITRILISQGRCKETCPSVGKYPLQSAWKQVPCQEGVHVHNSDPGPPCKIPTLSGNWGLVSPSPPGLSLCGIFKQNLTGKEVLICRATKPDSVVMRETSGTGGKRPAHQVSVPLSHVAFAIERKTASNCTWGGVPKYHWGEDWNFSSRLEATGE